MTEGYLQRFGGIARLYGVAGLERLSQAHVCVIGIGGETRLMLLGALVLADELSESRARAERAEAEATRLREQVAQADSRAVAILEALAAKIESMAAR